MVASLPTPQPTVEVTVSIKLITTRTKTHLLAADAVPTKLVPAFQPFDQRARTACGASVDGLSGEHVAGHLPGSITCGLCRRTSLFAKLADEQWVREHRREIAQAEAYVRSRFFPPLPSEYGELAVRAVHAVNEGDPYARFKVGHLNPEPKGTAADGTVTAARLVEVLRLSHLIDDDASDIAYLD